jgi:hypothetical protein
MPVIITMVLSRGTEVAVCDLLEAPVEYIARDKAEAFTIYREVNDCRQSIKGRQVIEIYDKESRAVTEQQKRSIVRLTARIGGPQALSDFIATGGSLSLLSSAYSFCRKVGHSTPADVCFVASWSLAHGASRKLPGISKALLYHNPGLSDWLWQSVIHGSIELPASARPAANFAYCLVSSFHADTGKPTMLPTAWVKMMKEVCF